MGFKYLGRHCPVCNGARSDCRQNTTTRIVHCRNGSANPIGWHLIREDAQGFFMWGEGDGQDFISSEERERRQQDQKLERQRREEEKRRGALPSSERDTAIRKLSKHFGLAHRHRADLRRRGLTDEQIEKLGFFSIQPGERVPVGIPENLPGIKNGRICGTEGYACHAFDPQGQATGYQIRLDNPDDGGKYRWAKGAKSSHLPNGELPITYIRPLNGQIKRKAIGICEGILKPVVASQKLGQIFIGASSFMFSKDGDDENLERKPLEQLLQYLEAASSELGIKDVELYPDGGVPRNPQLYPKYQWLCDALAKLGYKVWIAWWGQLDKDKPDCDELPENQEIKLISPGKFADLAKRFGGANSAWMQKVRREWKKKRSFTPDFTDSSEWVDWDRPADNTLFFGRAGLGRGKTTQFAKWAKEWRAEAPDTRFFILGYRNTLLHQIVAKMMREGITGLEHIHDTDLIQRADTDTSFALCVDSLKKFQPEDFDDSIIFLDEIMSVIRHILHSPTISIYERDRILLLFEEAIRRARTVICMDGLLADWAVEYLAAIAPEKKIIKAQNTYKGNKPFINFLIGTQANEKTQDFDEKIKVNDRSPWIKFMLEEVRIPVICSDSQVFLESMDEKFQANGAKTLRIDSKTIPEEYAKEFLADCNKYIQENEIDVLLYSPSAESGLDVSIEGWFTHQFCFFFGVLGVDAIIQMIGRIRDSKVQRFLWCKEWVAGDEREHSKSPIIEEIEKSFGLILQEEIGLGMEKLSKELPDELAQKIFRKIEQTIKESFDQNFATSCLIKSIENAEKANLRSFLREALLGEGYGVSDLILPPFEDCKELEKDAKEEVKRRNCADIFNAPLKDEEIKKLAKSRLQFDAKWEQRCRRWKAVLLDHLPGIRDSEAWSEDFIYLTKYEEPEFISRQELFWLLKHPEEAEKGAIRRLHWFARVDKTFIGNIKSRFSKIRAYQKLEIERFLNLDATWNDSSPEIQDLLERCKDPAIAKSLGHPGKMGGIQNLKRAMQPLGIFFRESARFREQGKITRFYSVDTEKFFSPARLAVLKAIGIRYEKAKLEEKTLDWDDVLQSETSSDETPTRKHPEAAETTQNCDTPPKNIYINNRGGVTVSSEESEAEPYKLCDDTENFSDFSGKEAIGEIFEPTEKFVEILLISGKSVVIPKRSGGFDNTGKSVVIPKRGGGLDNTGKSAITWVGNVPIIIPSRVKQVAAGAVAATTIALGLPAAATPEPQNLQAPMTEISQAEKSQPEKSQAVQEYQWLELPKPGRILNWLNGGTEKLTLKAIEPDGRCQVMSLLSGRFTNTRISQLKPVNSG